MIQSVTERDFSAEVLKSKTPVLVNFGAPWCGFCRSIEPLLTQFQSRWGDRVKVVYVNADENFKLTNTYRLTKLPTLILLTNGREIQRLEGFQGRDYLRQDLERMIQIHEQVLDLAIPVSG
jgi:thioredoxin 1